MYNDNLKVLPLAVMGVILLCSGTGSIWIWPETKSIKLPETLEEANEIARSKNTWLNCSCWADIGCGCCCTKGTSGDTYVKEKVPSN